MPRNLSHRLFVTLTSSLILVLFSISIATAGGTEKTKSPFPVRYEQELLPGLVANEQQIRAGLLYDVERGKIVWQKDMDYAYPIASLTKMMVGLLAIEDINSGKLNWSDRITVTRTFKKGGRGRRHKTYTTEEHYTLEDLIKMAMVASHNESTVWIAKHCSGDLTAFVSRMNERAMQLGMTKTQYSNPSGLPAIIRELDNSSSPHDQLILGLEILKHPKLVEITSIPYLDIHNGHGRVNYRNHNGLVINYGQEVDGIKTGFTRAAGFCLVSTARRGGHRLVSVVFGCSSPWVRNGLVADMLNRYYSTIKLGRLGESTPDTYASRAFLDSVERKLVVMTPNHDFPIREDYSLTYKSVTEKVKKTVVVRPGDNLGQIAKKNGVTVQELKKWNKLHGSVIHAGQKLAVYKNVKKTIPVKLVVEPSETLADLAPSHDMTDDCETTSFDEEPTTAQHEVKNIQKDASPLNTENAPSSSVRKPYFFHVVQSGDTLWKIARQYELTPDQIKKLNNISNSNLLKKGTRIKIPQKS
jgi:D-alanyl-D-alanine carboxypeptidase (penicillin-binding protein 5/6)